MLVDETSHVRSAEAQPADSVTWLRDEEAVGLTAQHMVGCSKTSEADLPVKIRSDDGEYVPTRIIYSQHFLPRLRVKALLPDNLITTAAVSSFMNNFEVR